MSDALFTDLYELTMMAGYHAAGRAGEEATFDLYFRQPPAGVDLVVACGLDPALDYLSTLRFTPEDLEHLRTLKLFADDFLAFLEGLRFTGDVWAIPEGTPVFGDEPLLRVTAPLAEAQLVETALLNTICYSSLVASNAAQLAAAARGKSILEFGARRAHGRNGALTGARGAIIGGCTATSNVEAGRQLGVPVSGTQAHAWIMAFDSELEAFREYARTFPEHCVLLVDTYDTLLTGVPNAITVARELAEDGCSLAGIRLDSGDLAALATQSRRMLDAAGFSDVEILASGDLDAVRVAELETMNAPIDAYGVGTSLLTARQDPALSGVYKLAEIHGSPVMKLSSSAAKTTSPGRKQVWRSKHGDVIGLADEQRDGEPLLIEAMRSGRRLLDREHVTEIRRRCLEKTGNVRPHVVGGVWTVRRSQRLEELRAATMQRLRT
ncbi:MAG: nicotinate phosphoribosyltransferase [Nitriliruptorales bacterium]|nr:nicotinate phosphoribosyltransferase [Nitriliruptorales bacterium]